MKITPHLRIASRLASKDNPRLSVVSVTSGYVEATDCYSLIRIEHPAHVEGTYPSERHIIQADKLRKLSAKAEGLDVPSEPSDDFPVTDHIIPSIPCAASIVLDAEKLEVMAKALKDLAPHDRNVTIEIRGTSDPVVFRSASALGLIMPIRT